MGLLNNGTLIIIVWIQLCSAHKKIFQQPFQDIVLIIIGAVLLHFVFVAINWPLVAWGPSPAYYRTPYLWDILPHISSAWARRSSSDYALPARFHTARIPPVLLS